jgi:hypothetical protein
MDVCIILKRAVKDNDLHVIFYILDLYDLLTYNAFEYAAEICDIELMEKIYTNFGLVMLNLDFYKYLYNIAVKNDKYDVVQYLTKFLT